MPSRPLDIILWPVISRTATRTYQSPKAAYYAKTVCTVARMREMQGKRSVSRNRIILVAKRFLLAVCTSCIVHGILCTICMISCSCSTNHTTEARSLSMQDHDPLPQAMYYTPCQFMYAMIPSIKIGRCCCRRTCCQIHNCPRRITKILQYTQGSHGN